MLHQENICGKLSEVMKMWLVQIFFYGMMLAWLCFVKRGRPMMQSNDKTHLSDTTPF